MLLLARLHFLRAPTGSSVLHSPYSVHFLLPSAASCFVWSCSSGSASFASSPSGYRFPLRILSASSSSYFVCVCFVYFLLTFCLYTTQRLTPDPYPAHIQPSVLAVAGLDCICCDAWSWVVLGVFGAHKAVRPIGSRVASGCAPFLVDVDRIWCIRSSYSTHFLLLLLPSSSAPCFFCFLLLTSIDLYFL